MYKEIIPDRVKSDIQYIRKVHKDLLFYVTTVLDNSARLDPEEQEYILKRVRDDISIILFILGNNYPYEDK